MMGEMKPLSNEELDRPGKWLLHFIPKNFHDQVRWFDITKDQAIRLLARTPPTTQGGEGEKPFGTFIELGDGTTEFRRTGEPHSPTAQGYRWRYLYAAAPPAPASDHVGEGPKPVELELDASMARLLKVWPSDVAPSDETAGPISYKLASAVRASLHELGQHRKWNAWLVKAGEAFAPSLRALKAVEAMPNGAGRHMAPVKKDAWVAWATTHGRRLAAALHPSAEGGLEYSSCNSVELEQVTAQSAVIKEGASCAWRLITSAPLDGSWVDLMRDGLVAHGCAWSLCDDDHSPNGLMKWAGAPRGWRPTHWRPATPAPNETEPQATVAPETLPDDKASLPQPSAEGE